MYNLNVLLLIHFITFFITKVKIIGLIEHIWLIMINTNFYETEEIYSDLEICYIKLLNRIHDNWEENKAIDLETVIFIFILL